MSGQKNILSFFAKTTPTKRVLEATTNIVNNNESSKMNETPNKKLKTDEIQKKSPNIVQEKEVENIEKISKVDIVSKELYGMTIKMGSKWFKALESEFSKPYFKKLAEFVEEERKRATIYPPKEQVFAWSTYSDINNIKVVILGQDPYHGPNQAHGLCFSVRKGIATPPSLQNIYKELKTDINGFEIPKHGTLVGWASQGVLLLNACLTVRKGEANSHKDKGWETFTDSVVKIVNEKLNNVVFLLWGSYAQKRGAMIDKKKHLVLNCVHPSPLSANRGWFGCKHFSKANEYLSEHKKVPIDWCYLPNEDEFEAKKQQESLKNNND